MSVVSRGKNKSTSALVAVIIVIVSTALTFVGLKIINASTSVTEHNNPEVTESKRVYVPESTSVAEAFYSTPVRLKIPKIKVDAVVEHMGLTASGDMQSPGTNGSAGWYKYSSYPGNKGSSVIAGHVGVRNPAVFTHLDTLVQGDTVLVTDDKGQEVKFTVTSSKWYDYQIEATEVFESDKSGAHLNLITCAGDWDSSQDTYSQRLVVFADKVE